MQAIILAGGKGARLRPYTNIVPKPLLPIDNMPILEIILKQLKKYKFTEIVITIGHLGEIIKAYFGDGRKFDLKIRYSLEEKPLGTVGALSIVDNLEDNFLVMNGDILCNINFDDLYNFHLEKNKKVTIVTYEKNIKLSLGVIECKDDRLIDYIEKPEYKFDVSTGIYMLSKEVISLIPYNDYYDFPTLVKNIIPKEEINVYKFNGFWFDIGTPEDYNQAQDSFIKLRNMF
jgi:NDP-mannose synthase